MRRILGTLTSVALLFTPGIGMAQTAPSQVSEFNGSDVSLKFPPPVESRNAMAVSSQHFATQAGVDIMAAGGNAIDVAVVGNDDLSTGMGIPGQFTSDVYRNAVKEIIRCCNKHGVMPGIAAGDPEVVKYWAGQGMKMFWSAADICLLWSGAANCCSSVRKALET